jgi:hypothetical protein
LVLELKVLQAVRLKGLVEPDDLAATVDEADHAVAGTVAALTQSGLLVAGKTVKLSPDGRVRLAELLAAERSPIDADGVSAGYHAFRAVNADFKALVTDWQLNDGEPNTHEDADYDAAVLARLDDIHAKVIWVPDVNAPEFVREAHRQSAPVAASDQDQDDQAFVDAVSSDWDDDT